MVEVLVARVGIRKALKVLTFIVSWGIAYESLGHAPESIEEYAAWWRESRAKSFRDQQLFREALPGEDTPTRIYEAARVYVDVSNQAAPVLLGAMVIP